MWGNPSQTFAHLLWGCPLTPPPSPEIQHLADLPSAQSVAHLLPEGSDARDILIWKTSLTRAVRIMGMHDLTENLVHVRQDVDMKGHVFATSEDGSYVFCSRCFISRKSRDRKWILLHPCAYPDRPARNLWEEYTLDAHLVRLQMKRWRHFAWRPSLKCLYCEQEVWAKAGFPHACAHDPLLCVVPYTLMILGSKNEGACCPRALGLSDYQQGNLLSYLSLRACNTEFT